MTDLHTEPYAVQATAFWAIEKVYNEAWGALGQVAEGYQEFADRLVADEPC